MKSRSPSQIWALPTGGLSRWRCSSIHFLKLSGASSITSLHCCDALQLDGDGSRQAAHFHRRAAGRVLGEGLRPEPVIGGGSPRLDRGEEGGGRRTGPPPAPIPQDRRGRLANRHAPPPPVGARGQAL